MSATTVVLVGCSGSKLDHAAPAKDLYTSPLFKKCRAYAEALGVEWAILSALHGLVLPDQVLEPYDCTFAKLRGNSPSRLASLERWGLATQLAIRARWPEAKFVFLGGKDYAACLRGYGTGLSGGRPVDHLNPIIADAPLEGMGIGERLSWLHRSTEALIERRSLAGMRGEVEPDIELAPCDFCGDKVDCAVSELGEQRFPGDDTPARICEGCAKWALEQFAKKALVPA